MIKIAVCQYAIENLPNWYHYVEKVTSLIYQAKKTGAQLLLLPEYAGIEIAGYQQTDRRLYQQIQYQLTHYCDLFRNLAKQYHIYIQPGTILVETHSDSYVNRAYFFGPNGEMAYQDKLQLIEFEKQTGMIDHGSQQTLFETSFGKVGIAVCYDCEFPEIIRKLTLAGACLILVPSYTTTLAGLNRVSLSAQARALENQCFVATAFAVGEVALSDPADNTYGQASIFGPIESSFSDNGVIVQGSLNRIELITTEISFATIENIRERGEVHNFNDAKNVTNFIQHELMVKRI